MADRVYGVLLVSFSKHSHQKSFVPAFVDHPRIRIVGVADDADIDPYLKPLNQTWAEQLGVPCLEGIEAAVRRDEVDVVSIGHEIERRAEIARLAARAGKHLWIDKYIGANMRECRDVVEAVEGSGVTSILPSYVYNDFVNQSKKMIDAGILGDLTAMHVDILFGKGIPRPITSAQRKPGFLPPGRWKFPDIKRELLTVGAYAVALVQQCFDPIVEVYGQGGAYFFPEHAAHGADDFGTLTLVDRSGRVATLSAGRNGIASHGAGGPNLAYLFGSKGTGRIDGKRPGIDTHLRNRIVDGDYSIDENDPMQWHSGPPTLLTSTGPEFTRAALDDLVHALVTGARPRFTVRDARDHMEVLLAGYESIVRNQPVRLPLCGGEAA
ncbi:MAG: Gfo/Idh/MocA family oxidoreductase [Gemmatimonadetes bacterium]|nr:Gfo/Idh/MocA family oxidoreductase [Gemmatimonadota bacterium]MYG16284.1 Gfo/Idh/MocA family oxidoreductase [Gemmatimonadota bacterium]